MSIVPLIGDKFIEKSFEIRFCAALSAALMPFNRNPYWFGLSQKQERRHGVDAVLQLAKKRPGKLMMFQFKAKLSDKVYKDKIKLDKFQWSKLYDTGKEFSTSLAC